MAKQPWHRFVNMREFGDSLQKALRNEPLECFDHSKIKPRLERARQLRTGRLRVRPAKCSPNWRAEGLLDQDRQVCCAAGWIRRRAPRAFGNRWRAPGASSRPRSIRWRCARSRKLWRSTPGIRIRSRLKIRVEKERRREKKIDEWMQLARQHLENQAFRQAREALDNALKLRPNDTEALGAGLAEVERREQRGSRVREEKVRLYQGRHARLGQRATLPLPSSRLKQLMKLRIATCPTPTRAAPGPITASIIRSTRAQLPQERLRGRPPKPGRPRTYGAALGDLPAVSVEISEPRALSGIEVRHRGAPAPKKPSPPSSPGHRPPRGSVKPTCTGAAYWNEASSSIRASRTSSAP